MRAIEQVSAEVWAAYEQLQGIVERSRHCGAVDEACVRLVDELPSTASQRVTRRFVNLISEEKRKSQRRREIDTKVVNSIRPCTNPPAASAGLRGADLVAEHDEADQLRGALTSAELAIEDCLASGLSYVHLSELLGEPEGTIKSRVARGRARIRLDLKAMPHAA